MTGPAPPRPLRLRSPHEANSLRCGSGSVPLVSGPAVACTVCSRRFASGSPAPSLGPGPGDAAEQLPLTVFWSLLQQSRLPALNCSCKPELSR